MNRGPDSANLDPVPRLRAQALAKTFPPAARGGDPVRALRGVDLTIGAGEFVALVGPSGCGKSTLLSILAGLDPPSGGQILLDGRPAERLLGASGYMPQDDRLMPWLSVIDNAALAPRLGGLSRAAARERARPRLSRFGLDGFEDAWPRALSGGMRQRAALLRTFLADRDLLLLDEPFGALDALTRRAMQEWLLEVWAQDRPSVLFVTHDVEEALVLADRVYVMSPRPGRIELCVAVDLARPRDVLAPAFVELRGRVLGALAEPAPAR